MKPRFSRLLACALLASTAAAQSAVTLPKGTALQPSEASELRARCDGSLYALRAGWVGAPAPIDEEERAALRSAQEASPELQGLRAGSAGTVLLVLAVVLLVILLI